MKNISWQQVALCLGLVAALLAAGKYLPGGASQVVQVAALIFAFFRDPNSPPPAGPTALLPEGAK